MKKLLIGISVVGIGVAHAASFDGIHVGVQGGYGGTKGKVQSYEYSTNKPMAKSELNPMGFEGGFSLGYLHNVGSNVHVGIDCEANIPTGKAQNTFDVLVTDKAFTLKTKNKMSYAGSLVLGYAFGNAMPYVKLGYGMHKYSLDLARRVGGILPLPAYNAKKTKTLSGFRVALGSQIALSDCVLMGFEYGHTLLSKKLTISDDGAAGPNSRKFTLKPSAAQSFKLRLTYRFGM
ncbi:MAG: outer membrane beta-barrel protein [Alphaproteobacteria bacterium]|nr:MAG: outer membrane beta-barrel protein [Alphaproteobacteria bacterium]